MPYRSSDPQSQVDAVAVCESLGIDRADHRHHPAGGRVLRAFPGCGPHPQGQQDGPRAHVDPLRPFDGGARARARHLEQDGAAARLRHPLRRHGERAEPDRRPLQDAGVRAGAQPSDLPQSVLTKAPSADLWAGQSDEDELGMRYAVVDQVLHLLVDERRSRAEVIALGFDAADVDSDRGAGAGKPVQAPAAGDREVEQPDDRPGVPLPAGLGSMSGRPERWPSSRRRSATSRTSRCARCACFANAMR